MRSAQYCVYVVLEREYGERLCELAKKGPVWIVDTPLNRAAAQRVWAEHPGQSHLEGVTILDVADGFSSEDCLLGELDMIDLHHGAYSTDQPYTALEIIGSSLTHRIRSELSQYDFNEFHVTDSGFRAVRPLLIE